MVYPMDTSGEEWVDCALRLPPPRDPGDLGAMSDVPRYQRFFAELKRRKVFQVAAVYGAGMFGVLQAADVLVPAVQGDHRGTGLARVGLRAVVTCI